MFLQTASPRSRDAPMPRDTPPVSYSKYSKQYPQAIDANGGSPSSVPRVAHLTSSVPRVAPLTSSVPRVAPLTSSVSRIAPFTGSVSRVAPLTSSGERRRREKLTPLVAF